MNLITRLLQFDTQRRLPPQYLLFYSRIPNNWLDVGWETDFGWDSNLSAWSIPRTVTDWTGTERDMFTILGEGIFFDAAGNSLVVTGTQILAWSGINQYHILFSLTKGLVIYDYTVATDTIINKAHGFYRVSKISSDGLKFNNSYILFNGTQLIF